MSVGVRAFAAYANREPSGDQELPPTKCCTCGSFVSCSGQPPTGVEQVQLMKLVAVVIRTENDAPVRRATLRRRARSRR